MKIHLIKEGCICCRCGKDFGKMDPRKEGWTANDLWYYTKDLKANNFRRCRNTKKDPEKSFNTALQKELSKRSFQLEKDLFEI